MKLSVIIVNYNTSKLLQKCLESIVREGGLAFADYEIIVVDNDSSDSSRADFQKWQKKQLGLKTTLIANQGNLGFGRANNQAAKIARGQYLLFLNTDIEVLPKAISRLLAFMIANKDAGIVGGKLYNKDKTDQPSCGAFYSLWISLLMLFFQGDQLRLTRWSPGRVKVVDWVSGACLMISAANFLRLQGFDDAVFMYMEEVDLCYRAKQFQLQSYFYPEARFIHLGAATSQSLTEPTLNIYRGLIYFYQKHYRPWQTRILKMLLFKKAVLAYAVGVMTGNGYLKTTYGKALKLVG